MGYRNGHRARLTTVCSRACLETRKAARGKEFVSARERMARGAVVTCGTAGTLKLRSRKG